MQQKQLGTTQQSWKAKQQETMDESTKNVSKKGSKDPRKTYVKPKQGNKQKSFARILAIVCKRNKRMIKTVI